MVVFFFFFFQAEDGIRDDLVTGVQTCALPISGRWRAGLPGAVAARGDRQALLTQDPADRLDPVPSRTLHVDERADQRWRGSSSLAKKIEAAFRISLASRRSRTSALSRRISS